MSPEEKIHTALCSWFEKDHRKLPWRESYNPYFVWISEIMLQQTRVETVISYYERWISELPTIASVAEASDEKLIKLWEGLGYYSRVRNIKKAAQYILNVHDGKLPESRDELIKVPGIGEYTSGAISSIAFERNVSAVDGNVKRVLSRIYDVEEDITTALANKYFREKADLLVSHGKARTFNQSLMELGAKICLPKNPQCRVCPTNELCISNKLGTVAQRPVKKKKMKIFEVNQMLFVIKKGEHFLIHKWLGDKLWKGLWSFPMISILNLEQVEKEELIYSFLSKYNVTKINYFQKNIDLTYFFTKFKAKAELVFLTVDVEFLENENTKLLDLKTLKELSLNKPSREIVRVLEEA